MRVVKALLRFFSYLYHGLFALAMVVFGAGIALIGATDTVRLKMVPWAGSTLIGVFVLGGLIGLLTVILAMKGKLRPLFFLWALLVTLHLVKFFFLDGGYRFTPDSFRTVVWLVVTSIVALLGAFVQMFGRGRRR